MYKWKVSVLNQTVSNSARALLLSKQDVINNQINQQSVRYARNIKPYNRGPVEDWKKNIYNYSYRKARAKKVLKIDLPDFQKYRNFDQQMTPDQIRSQLKERGVVPARKWIEKPIYMSDSGRILDSYIPPEGDGVASIISKEGVSQKTDIVKSRGKELLAARKLRKHLPEFDPHNFGLEEGLEIYIKAHEALAERNFDALTKLVTDFCLPKMLFSSEMKTIKWKFLKNIELPRLVNLKVMEQEGFSFGQITVRFHSQQILAVYDKFGRLVYGSEAIIKDVLEYIVFENRISSTSNEWKIHAKILPEWQKSNSELGSETVVISEEKRS